MAGAPGCGKSTLCYPVWGDKSVTWDGSLPPLSWQPFIDEMTRLMSMVGDHPSFPAVLRMNDRSLKKMATVARMDHPGVFVQTGLVQRVLGFGWRLVDLKRDVNLIRPALKTMPVSVGVAFLNAGLDVILTRNRLREQDPRTAHENRSYQVPLMLPAIEVAKEALLGRGVAVCEVDTAQPLDAARSVLLDFANREFADAPASGPCREISVLRPPPWWQ